MLLRAIVLVLLFHCVAVMNECNHTAAPGSTTSPMRLNRLSTSLSQIDMSVISLPEVRGMFACAADGAIYIYIWKVSNTARRDIL